jgi:subtilisin
MQEARRYIVLPAFGFRSPTLAQSEKLANPGALIRLSARPALRERGGNADDSSTVMRVLDSTHEDGPKLVEMTPDAELNLRAEVPGLKIVPLVYYHTLRSEQSVQKPVEPPPRTITINVIDAQSNRGIASAKVIAFTNFRNRAGAEGFTAADGSVQLDIEPDANLDRLYVYGPATYWGHFSASQKIPANSTISLEPVNLNSTIHVMRSIYGNLPAEAGRGIRVAVIDTGVAKGHPLLPNVSGGANMVFDEIHGNPGEADDWGPADVEGEHGTHVAGIIGARSTPNWNLRGVAPGVEIRSYRVFPRIGGGASNYDILSAIDRAVSDGCHVVNLSLGGGTEDEAIRAAIGAALAAGTLVIAAAGNDYRKSVSFPASIDFCVAVSAMGRMDGFPSNSVEHAEVARPYGTDPKEFVAAFSNYGPQIALVGPGVGIVSALPGNTYGIMSGTSMACPAVSGFAAYLLGSNPTILSARGDDRIRQWKALLCGSAKPVGFGRDYEGFGLPSIPLTS